MRPSYGSVLIPLFEEDGLRMSDIAHRARLSKQTMTTLVRLCERDGLVTRRPDPDDGRAARVHLTQRARASRLAAERVLAELEATVVAQLGERRADGSAQIDQGGVGVGDGGANVSSSARVRPAAYGAAMESNHPSVGLPRPAGFEGRMGHQTRAAPRKSKARERSAVPDGADPDFDFDAGRIAGRAAATGRKPQRRARCVPVAAGH